MYKKCNIEINFLYNLYMNKCMYRLLTMEGRGVCYKAPPQEQVWLQSHTCSLRPPRLYHGSHIR